MSKAEKYIKDYTKNCSNQHEWNVQTATEEISYFQPWLTPDQAREAVEIARKEIIEKVAEWLEDFCNEHYIMSYSDSHEIDNSKELIEIFKSKMEENK